MASDEEHTSSAYFARFNSDVLGIDSKHMPASFKGLRDVWQGLHLELAGKRAGEFGILGLPHDPQNSPLLNRPNINLPLSQCLFRRTDRDRLDELLQDWSDLNIGGEGAFIQLLRYVEQWPERFTVALRNNLRVASKDNDFRAAYVEELADMLSDAPLEAINVPKRKLDKSTGLGIARVRMLPRYNSNGMVYDFTLEALSNEAWCDVPEARLESNDVVGRYRTFFEDRECGYPGSNPQLFIEEDTGDCTSLRQARLPSRAHLVMVATKAYTAELLRFAEGISKATTGDANSVSVLPLMERFENLTAIAFDFSSKAAEGIAFPKSLSRYSLSRTLHIALAGGLRIDGRYLPGALPYIEIDWEGNGDPPEIACDGIVLENTVGEDRLEFRLPELARSTGLHVISASDGSRESFEVRDIPSMPKLLDDVPSVSIYFGGVFLYSIRSAKDFKLARRQSGGSRPTAFLMQGARLYTRESRLAIVD